MEQPFGQALDGPAEEEQERGKDCGDSEQDPITKATNDAEDRADPDRRSRSQSRDVAHRVAHDHPGTEKPDTGQDALDHAADRVRVDRQRARGSAERHDRRDSGPKTNQGVSAKAGWFAVQFAV